MTYTLRQLEAELLKTVTVTTTEIETDKEDHCRGQFVFRDENGEKFMWSPRPVRYQFHPAQTVAEADSVSFLCPLCFQRNGGAAGTHGVHVTFADRDVPDEASSRNSEGRPTRWAATGTSLDDLALTPSILLDAGHAPEQGCHWHGFVGSAGIPPGHAG